MPENFEFDDKTAKIALKSLKPEDSYPEFFVYVIRPKSVGISPALEVDSMHDATKEIVKALIIHWDRECRKRKRMEAVNMVEQKIQECKVKIFF